jgi:hypothetical protein
MGKNHRRYVMTYGQLLVHIYQLTPDQLDQNVTVICNDEHVPVDHIGLSEDDDVLDDDHIVLMTGGM